MSDAAPDVMALRRLLAAERAGTTADDVLRWAEACADAGLPDAARLLARSALIRLGLSPQQRRAWRDVASRLGIKGSGAAPPIANPNGRDTIAIALDEWRTFVAAIAEGVARASADVPDTPPHEVRRLFVHPGDLTGGDAVTALFELLYGPAPTDWAAAEGRLGAIVDAAARSPRIDRRWLAGAELATIADALSRESLCLFIAAHHDLLAPPHGSAELLWRASRFDSAGLGPYFGNVRRLARTSRGVFELAFEAEDAARAAGVLTLGIAPWIGLLGRDLPDLMLFEVIDDLGDRGDLAALGQLFQRTVGKSPKPADLALLQRLRDTALDNGDHVLAATAQMRIVALLPDSIAALALLGSIDASAGLIAAAEQSFLACLERDPLDIVAAERLVALRGGRFAPYRVDAGLATPLDRRIGRRLARAQRGRARDPEANPVALALR